MNATINANNANNAAATTAEGRLNIKRIDYVAHWIKINSHQEDAKMIADYALQGKRIKRMPLEKPILTELETPENFWVGETNRQFWTALEVAGSFGHLWGMDRSSLTIKDALYNLCDHVNDGYEDFWNPGCHDEPCKADESASRRFSWEVFPNGMVFMKINRPSGVACVINGMIREPDTIRIRFNGKLVERRHLHCCYQRLTDTFGVSKDEAVELIEESKDFRSTGFRYGEIASLELDKYLTK